MSSLKNYFKGSASKYLSVVDATSKSNQHEIGSNKFVAILGDPGSNKLHLEATFIYFNKDEELEVCRDGVTYYNTRLNQPSRSAEYRLYYRNNSVTERMTVGDFCLVALRTNNELLICITPPDSAYERRLRYLFDVPEAGDMWRVDPQPGTSDLDLAATSILSALGIEIQDAADDMLGKIIDKFGFEFPRTREFSAFARLASEASQSATEAPDDALETWMRDEERLFRTLEQAIVSQRIKEGFRGVDDFVSFSLSVQNRRKSRAGHALENHLEAIFIANEIRFEKGPITEGRSRPDFLFPSQKEYQDPSVRSPPLRMLAAKSSCKDRWRQVLAEAARIPEKHLFTLETAISENQTNEMKIHKLRLVVPRSVAKTFTTNQQVWLLSLENFIELVR